MQPARAYARRMGQQTHPSRNPWKAGVGQNQRRLQHATPSAQNDDRFLTPGCSAGLGGDIHAASASASLRLEKRLMENSRSLSDLRTRHDPGSAGVWPARCGAAMPNAPARRPRPQVRFLQSPLPRRRAGIGTMNHKVRKSLKPKAGSLRFVGRLHDSKPARQGPEPARPESGSRVRAVRRIAIHLHWNETSKI